MRNLVLLTLIFLACLVNGQDKRGQRVKIRNGLFLTKIDAKVGLTDKKGNVIIPVEYDAIEFDGNLGMTMKEGKMGLIDIHGNILIPNEYDLIEMGGSKVTGIKNGKRKIIKI